MALARWPATGRVGHEGQLLLFSATYCTTSCMGRRGLGGWDRRSAGSAEGPGAGRRCPSQGPGTHTPDLRPAARRSQELRREDRLGQEDAQAGSRRQGRSGQSLRALAGGQGHGRPSRGCQHGAGGRRPDRPDVSGRRPRNEGRNPFPDRRQRKSLRTAQGGGPSGDSSDSCRP